MQIKFTSLEHEVVRLKEVEKKFHHFKFVEKVASKARNEKQHKLFQVIGQQNDKIETQNNNVTALKEKYDAIIKQQNEHIQKLKLDHAKVISDLRNEMENLKAAQQQRESHVSRTKKRNKLTNVTKLVLRNHLLILPDATNEVVKVRRTQSVIAIVVPKQSC